MPKFEELKNTFFYFRDANTIVMVTNGKERLRVNFEGNIRIGTPIPQNLVKKEFEGRLRVIGEQYQGNQPGNIPYVFVATDADENELFTVRCDGLINLYNSPVKGFQITNSLGDWLFLKQERDIVHGGGGFHIYNPWGEEAPHDVNDPRNRLEIRYKMPGGQDTREPVVIHGPTGNIGIGIETPGKDKLRIKGANNGADAALNVTNQSNSSLFSIRNNGEIHLRSLPVGSSTGIPVLFEGGKLIRGGSSKRFKHHIRPLKENFELLLQAEPKSFHWRETGQQGIGYIAEELHELGLSHLVAYDEDGQPFSVNYQLFPLYQLEILKGVCQSTEKLVSECATLTNELAQAKTELQQVKDKLAQMESMLQKRGMGTPVDEPERTGGRH
ncbi:MAG: tail fiber domain-containing protein [Calditrichaeota bacterium]|nr:tail fiber domain-containing protein [Calditrichota bacterium]MCB0302331.1 tail fiber domain-containing protein [Calditrichota bacterium]